MDEREDILLLFYQSPGKHKWGGMLQCHIHTDGSGYNAAAPEQSWSNPSENETQYKIRENVQNKKKKTLWKHKHHIEEIGINILLLFFAV